MQFRIRNLKLRQTGSALLVSLLILIIITILSLSAMNSSMMQQRMAANFQAEMEAFEYAQSIMDVILNENHFEVKSPDSDGDDFEEYTSCYSSSGSTDIDDSRGNDCNDATSIDSYLSSILSDNLHVSNSTAVTAEIAQFGELAGFRSKFDKGSSAGSFSYISFEVRAAYDDTANSYGKSEVVQGYILQIALADNSSLLE